MIEDSAKRLKMVLQEHVRDFGFIGIGDNELIVYAHSPEWVWKDKRIESIDGFRISWRFNIGATRAHEAV